MPTSPGAGFTNVSTVPWARTCPRMHRVVEPSTSSLIARRARIRILQCGSALHSPAVAEAVSHAAAAIAHGLTMRRTLCDERHPCNASASTSPDGALVIHVSLPVACKVCEPHGEVWQQLGVQVQHNTLSFRLDILARWWCEHRSKAPFLQPSSELRTASETAQLNRLLLLKPRPTVYYRGSWHPLPTATPNLREMMQGYAASFHRLLSKITDLGKKRTIPPAHIARLGRYYRDSQEPGLGQERSHRRLHGECAVVWSGFDLLCTEGGGRGAEIDAHDAIFRAGATQSFAAYDFERLGKTKLSRADPALVGRRTTYRMDGPLDACIGRPPQPSSTCVIASSWWKQGWLSEANVLRQLPYPCCEKRWVSNLSLPRLHSLVSQYAVSLAFALDDDASDMPPSSVSTSATAAHAHFAAASEDLDPSVLPGMDGMRSHENSEGRALLAALSACDRVDLYGAGLVAHGEEPASSATGATASEPQPREVVAGRFYDAALSRCVANSTANWRTLLDSKSNRARLRKRGHSWATSRLASEVLLQVLHSFGILTWQQSGRVTIQGKRAPPVKVPVRSGPSVSRMPRHDDASPRRSSKRAADPDESQGTSGFGESLADREVAQLVARHRTRASAQVRASEPLVYPEEHLLLPIAAGPFAALQPRYFSIIQLPKGAKAEQWLAGGNIPPSASGRQGWLPRWGKPWARRIQSGGSGSLLLFARAGADVGRYATVLFVANRVAVADSSSSGAGAPPAAEYIYEPSSRHVVRSHTVSHNLAAALDQHAPTGSLQLWAVGGQHKSRRSPPEILNGWHPSHNTGIFVLNATSLFDILSQRWFPYQRHEAIGIPAAIKGGHPGCVERRREFGRQCEFDGKTSLVHFRARWVVFARANLKESGGRHVQVASSLADNPGSGFGPFSLLNIAGYQPLGPGNIYLACVKPMPSMDRGHRLSNPMLLGLFAVNMGNDTWDEGTMIAPDSRERQGKIALDDGNTDGKSFVGLSLSCNGKDWSALNDIVPSIGALGRTYDHPADGLLVTEGAGGRQSVSIVIQRDVFEISPQANDHSRLVRRELRMDALAKLARRVQSELPGCAELNKQSHAE